MRSGTPELSSLKRSLLLLELAIQGRGSVNLSQIAAKADIPLATAHRQITTLVSERLLVKCDNGGYVAGPRLLGLLHLLDEKQSIVHFAAYDLHVLSEKYKCIVQLGTLENEMVTYRVKTGEHSGGLFTQVGMQMEAYCSAIGKVLIANMPDAELQAYLKNGPFVPLTEATITDANDLKAELEKVREQGFALDVEEVMNDLRCVAVPVCGIDGNVIAAISMSQFQVGEHAPPLTEFVEPMRKVVAKIESQVNGAQ